MASTCDRCDRSFENLKGLRIHRSSCEKKERVIINCFNVEQQNIGNEHVNNQLETSMIVNMSEIPIERNENIDVTLPLYKPDPLLNIEWHEYSGKQFVSLINSTYDDIIHWRKKLFKLPNYQRTISLT